MATGNFKCPKCERSFSMAAHLARHMNSQHASPKKKAAIKRKAKAKKAKKTKRAKGVTAKTAGRQKKANVRLGLRNMTLEQLAEVIAAARDEARRKLALLEASIS